MITNNRQISFLSCVLIYFILLFLTRSTVSTHKNLVNIAEVTDFQHILSKQCAVRGSYYQLYLRLNGYLTENPDIKADLPVSIPKNMFQQFSIRYKSKNFVLQY